MPLPARSNAGLRLVALYEGTKAALVLLTGFGLLALIHRDVHALAAHIIVCMHLNPANNYPRIFVDAAGKLTDTRLWLLALSALIYSLARGIEAYGLWRERVWAEWFALVTACIYLPIEIYEMAHGVTPFKGGVLLINVGIILHMGFPLRHNRAGSNSPFS